MTETIVTLTLPERNGNGTLVLRRGEVGHVAHFTYTSIHELTEVIAEALLALSNAEETMPTISEAAPPPPPKPAKPAQAAAPRKVAPAAAPEPTIDIPLRKGKKAVKISHLKIVEGQTDAAAYAVAARIASKLIDGKLWDGNSKIELPDVYQLEKKMRHLDAADMALYALADFTAGELVGTYDTPNR